ncbi:MAG TPA: MBL fold metallo-hydrolase [Gaiellales bacterium]|jgi:glyoxylase-like metal-dependent hydrolase (beta-lactamase superfamily II)|nr:MBL fold metallo-hydrolase [Gaiellales bacterium]
MSEAPEIAEDAISVVPGVWHWRISNSAIGGSTSSSQAVADGGGSVLIDPVRLAPQALATLPRPSATVITARCHQRSAWRYRQELGAGVWAPTGAPAADEEPDHRYGEGDLLPGGLRAVHTPGPEPVHYCLLREGDPGVLFCSDLLTSSADGSLHYVPLKYHDDPDQTRRSVRALLDLPFTVLCLDHGPPVTGDPRGAIETLLGSDE